MKAKISNVILVDMDILSICWFAVRKQMAEKTWTLEIVFDKFKVQLL